MIGQIKISTRTHIKALYGTVDLLLPWPVERLGEYGSGEFDGSPTWPEATDRAMDMYVEEALSLPDGIGIQSIIAGRVKRRGCLTPVIVVRICSLGVNSQMGTAPHHGQIFWEGGKANG